MLHIIHQVFQGRKEHVHKCRENKGGMNPNLWDLEPALGGESVPCLAAQVAAQVNRSELYSVQTVRCAHMEQVQASVGSPGDTVNSKG